MQLTFGDNMHVAAMCTFARGVLSISQIIVSSVYSRNTKAKW